MLCKLLRGWGLKSERVGVAYASGHDVDFFVPGRDAPFCTEVKARASGFKTLHAFLERDGADMLALKTDNKEFIFVIPERVLRELLCQ